MWTEQESHMGEHIGVRIAPDSRCRPGVGNGKLGETMGVKTYKR